MFERRESGHVHCKAVLGCGCRSPHVRRIPMGESPAFYPYLIPAQGIYSIPGFQYRVRPRIAVEQNSARIQPAARGAASSPPLAAPSPHLGFFTIRVTLFLKTTSTVVFCFCTNTFSHSLWGSSSHTEVSDGCASGRTYPASCSVSSRYPSLFLYIFCGTKYPCPKKAGADF